MRKSLIIGAAVVAGAVAWALFRPERLFVDQKVSEAFPALEQPPADMTPTPAMADSHAMVPSSGMADSHATMAAGSMAEGSAELRPAATEVAAMSDDIAASVSLVSGRFHSNAHETGGVATVYRLADGRRVLRLTGFETSNGPDVRVYLVAAADAQEPAAVKAAGFVDLGAMKGNVGDQNYVVPAGLDLSKYRAVSIWCRRFGVNFGAAPLRETRS